MKLQIGMHVKVKNNRKDFKNDAGKTKEIAAILPDFHGERAFALSNDAGIWLIEDFDKCIEYPNQIME